MQNASPRRSRSSTTALALVACLASMTSCTSRPQTLHPRPAVPLPAEVAARYAIPGPVVEEVFVPTGGKADGTRFFRGRLTAGHEETEFNLILPPGAAEDGEGLPFAVMLPILGGGSELMWILADILTAHGWAVSWTERVGSVMRIPQLGPDLETMFRRTVIHNRMVLEWARNEPGIDGEHPLAIGVSLGGMVASVLLAAEPRLVGAAVVISGGDLPALIPGSREGRVRRWADWRAKEHGMPRVELARELEREMLSDPARLGAFVHTDEVLMVSATLDTVIPQPSQDLLWESFGRPERMFVPLHHYTSAVAILAIMDRVHEFFTDRRTLALAARPDPMGRGLAHSDEGPCDTRPPRIQPPPHDPAIRTHDSLVDAAARGPK